MKILPEKEVCRIHAFPLLFRRDLAQSQETVDGPPYPMILWTLFIILAPK